MTDDTRFDDQRSAAWRDAIVREAREGSSGHPGPRKRIALIVALVIAALAVSGGGVAYALSATVFRSAPAPTASATPITRETPQVTSPPPASPSPTQDPSERARLDAQQACGDLSSALDADGNIVSPEAWASALENARQAAASAAQSDATLETFASHVAALSQTPLPGAAATDAEKDAYFDAYLPVATDCTSFGVPLGTD